MKRYKRWIDTHYDWSDETDANKAFENAYIVDEESPDGNWVRWDDVNKETIPIPDVRVVETDAHDPRERFAVYLNDVSFGIYSNRMNAENYVKTIKQVLGITINNEVMP